MKEIKQEGVWRGCGAACEEVVLEKRATVGRSQPLGAPGGRTFWKRKQHVQRLGAAYGG